MRRECIFIYSSFAPEVTLSLIVIWVFVLAFDGQTLQGNMDHSKVDSYVESQMDTWHIPGAALATLQLVEQGKVRLDAPVQEYLPWFRVADADASTPVTIRHLLHHTSGISQADSNRHVMINPYGLTLKEQIRALKDVTLTTSPGTQDQYSNLNYMTLALVMEKVTGQSYGDYLQENIFAPLKMQNSFTAVTEARQHGLSDGHTWWFGVPFKSLEWLC